MEKHCIVLLNLLLYFLRKKWHEGIILLLKYPCDYFIYYCDEWPNNKFFYWNVLITLHIFCNKHQKLKTIPAVKMSWYSMEYFFPWTVLHCLEICPTFLSYIHYLSLNKPTKASLLLGHACSEICQECGKKVVSHSQISSFLSIELQNKHYSVFFSVWYMLE